MMCDIKLFVWYLLVSCVWAQLESPCPLVFRYQMDGNTLYGMMWIQSPSADARLIQVNMELSVGNRVEGYNGNIELAFSKEHIVQDILNNRPITYKVWFPVWSNIPPKITKIRVNGNLICSGPKIDINSVQVLTTINLQHTLRVDVTPLSSPVANNRLDDFPFWVNYERRQPPYPNRFGSRPGAGTSSNRFYDSKASLPDFDFSIAPPPIQNNINFKPQPPKDPSNVYTGNPFISIFSNKTSTEAPTQNAHKPPPFGGNPFFSPTLDDRQKPELQQPVELPVRDSDGQSISEVCGRPIVTNSLIVGGFEVPQGAYPWLTAIFRVLPAGLTYICSGSLISHQHVVTAAHCVFSDSRKLNSNELLMVLGKLNIAKWTTPGQEMVESKKIHVHPDYTSSSSDADIAVIELSKAVLFSRVIKPICLWQGSHDLDRVVGDIGVVAGWGKNENGEISTAEPKQTKLPIVDQLTCLRSSQQFHYITSNRTFCAGFQNGTGPCNGDSGSGLILKKSQIWMLRGIVSMSISDTHVRTCDLNHYVVFTDATKFLNWLKSFLS